jgi:hypothetical protein
MESNLCPVCYSQHISLLKHVANYPYYQCDECQVIFIDTDILDRMDQGEPLIEYKENYWKEEYKAARERSWGVTLARTAELFLYARIPIKKFIDLGSGPGFFLDAINYQLPSSPDVFYANELFPPSPENCTKNPNYHRGSFLDLAFNFDAGCCIEVIEHLTPAMLKTMMTELATKSKPNSIYIFNTGMTEYIKNEDITYLDPLVRGHIMGWSIKALQILLKSTGFKIMLIPGKTWAFIAEFKPDHNFTNSIQDRIWHALPENLQILKDEKTGELLYVLALDTARAYT